MSLGDVGFLLLRLALGLTFAAHGAQKVFGWWGGPGPQRWHGAVEQMGFRPAPFFASLSMLIELIGGLLVAIGLFTPFAAAALVAQSIVIIARAHFSKGFFNTGGGFEFPLALGLVGLALTLLEAGDISLDAALGLAWPTQLRALLALLALIGGGIALAMPRIVEERASSGDKLRRT
jgi:putative oxidoreductase